MLLDNLWGHTFAEKGDEFYFSAVDFNGLFKVNKYTGVTEFMGQFEGEDPFQYNVHCYTYSDEKNIYFLPWRGHHIHILDVTTGKIEKIRVSRADGEFHIFMDVRMNGDNFYFHSTIGEVYAIRCDIKNKESCVCDIGELKGKQFNFNKQNKVFMQCMQRKNELDFYNFVTWYPYDEDRCYTLDPYGNHIFIFNENTKEIEKIELKVQNEQEYKIFKEKVKKENISANVVYEDELGWGLEDFISFIQK